MRTPPPPASAGAGVLRPRIPAEKDVGLRFPPRTAARKSASRAPAGEGEGPPRDADESGDDPTVPSESFDGVLVNVFEGTEGLQAPIHVRLPEE